MRGWQTPPPPLSWILALLRACMYCPHQCAWQLCKPHQDMIRMWLMRAMWSMRAMRSTGAVVFPQSKHIDYKDRFTRKKFQHLVHTFLGVYNRLTLWQTKENENYSLYECGGLDDTLWGMARACSISGNNSSIAGLTMHSAITGPRQRYYVFSRTSILAIRSFSNIVLTSTFYEIGSIDKSGTRGLSFHSKYQAEESKATKVCKMSSILAATWLRMSVPQRAW